MNGVTWNTSPAIPRLPMEADPDTNNFKVWPSYPVPRHALLPPFPSCSFHRRWRISKSHSFCRETWGLPHNPNSLRENSHGGVPHVQCIPYAHSEAKRHPVPHIWHRPPMLADIFLLRPSDSLPLSGRKLASSMISCFSDVCICFQTKDVQVYQAISGKMDINTFPLT